MLCNIEDIVPEPADTEWFSTLDLLSEFYQLPLATEGRLLTTFITPFGRYHFNGEPMGISIDPGEFKRKMHEVCGGMKGTKAIMDDVLIFGQTKEVHDHILKTVL